MRRQSKRQRSSSHQRQRDVEIEVALTRRPTKRRAELATHHLQDRTTTGDVNSADNTDGDNHTGYSETMTTSPRACRAVRREQRRGRQTHQPTTSATESLQPTSTDSSPLAARAKRPRIDRGSITNGAAADGAADFDGTIVAIDVNERTHLTVRIEDGEVRRRESGILSLPDTVLAHVFELMPFQIGRVEGVNWGWRGLDCELALSIPLVCKRFRSICRTLVRLECLTMYWIAHHQSLRGSGSAPGDMSRVLTPSVVSGVIGRFRDVTVLDFEYCFDMPPSSYVAAAACCPHLRFLNGETERCVGDDELASIAKSCPRLKHIRLVGNLTATDVGIAALAAHCPLLEHLDLPRCASISDDALRAIAASCPRLRHLCLTWSSAATDAGVATVAHGCPRLRHVEFEGYTRLTDAGLRELGTYCPDLCFVSVSACALITNQGVRGLVDSCAGLRLPRKASKRRAKQRIVLWQPIPGVTAEGIQSIAEDYPHLEIDS